MGMLPAGDLAIFSVIPKSGPEDQATIDLVTALRDPGSSVARANGVTLGVTGLTAINIDISEKLAGVLPIYIAIIVGLSLIILTLVFRSLVIPVVATLGFLLSIVATFGLTTAVFHWGWAGGLIGVDTPGPVISMLPIMVTGILYGLAMDYQVFLVTSMREAHVHGHKGVAAVVHGFDQASRVVVAAAIIMTAVFAGFIFSHDAMIKQFGLALAAGIVIDAFLVRHARHPGLDGAAGGAGLVDAALARPGAARPRRRGRTARRDLRAAGPPGPPSPSRRGCAEVLATLRPPRRGGRSTSDPGPGSVCTPSPFPRRYAAGSPRVTGRKGAGARSAPDVGVATAFHTPHVASPAVTPASSDTSRRAAHAADLR